MDTLIDLHRFREELGELTQRIANSTPEKHGILLYGSSTMGNWRANDMCYKQLAPLPISNTGFGGSTAEEALYYYHQLVVPYAPKVMAYYEGANDLMNGYTPEFVLEMTHRLFEWCRQDFPGIRFLILPIKLSPALDHIRKEGDRCNSMFEAYAAEHDDTSFVDVQAFMYDSDGNHRKEIYVADLLHHNESGYAELAALMKPQLQELLELSK